MSFITKENHRTALQANLEVLARSEGFLNMAVEIKKVLAEPNLVPNERFQLIDRMDDRAMAEGHKLMRQMENARVEKAAKEAGPDASPLSALAAVLGKGTLSRQDVDFGSEYGRKVAACDGQRLASRCVLKTMRLWKESPLNKQPGAFAEATELAKKILDEWFAINEGLRTAAAKRVKALEAMSFN